jgi:hypothetical protein
MIAVYALLVVKLERLLKDHVDVFLPLRVL